MCKTHVTTLDRHTLLASELAALHAGSLPASWGSPGAFPALQYMGLAGNNLTGSLPDSWAAPGEPPFALQVKPLLLCRSVQLCQTIMSAPCDGACKAVGHGVAWLHLLFSLLTLHTLSR
jgi:hypothetical protein